MSLLIEFNLNKEIVFTQYTESKHNEAVYKVTEIDILNYRTEYSSILHEINYCFKMTLE